MTYVVLALVRTGSTSSLFFREKAQAYQALAEWAISELPRQKEKRFVDQLDVQKQTFSDDHPLWQDLLQQLGAVERMWNKLESEKT